MDKLQAARQLRRAIEIFAESLQLDDERALEISGLYPAWRVGQNYTAGQIISYGETTGGSLSFGGCCRGTHPRTTGDRAWQ